MTLEELEEYYENTTIKDLTLEDLKEGDIFVFLEAGIAPHIVVKDKYYNAKHDTFYVDVKRTNITDQGYDGGMGLHHKVKKII